MTFTVWKSKTRGHLWYCGIVYKDRLGHAYSKTLFKAIRLALRNLIKEGYNPKHLKITEALDPVYL